MMARVIWAIVSDPFSSCWAYDISLRRDSSVTALNRCFIVCPLPQATRLKLVFPSPTRLPKVNWREGLRKNLDKPRRACAGLKTQTARPLKQISGDICEGREGISQTEGSGRRKPSGLSLR